MSNERREERLIEHATLTADGQEAISAQITGLSQDRYALLVTVTPKGTIPAGAAVYVTPVFYDSDNHPFVPDFEPPERLLRAYGSPDAEQTPLIVCPSGVRIYLEHVQMSAVTAAEDECEYVAIIGNLGDTAVNLVSIGMLTLTAASYHTESPCKALLDESGDVVGDAPVPPYTVEAVLFYALVKPGAHTIYLCDMPAAKILKGGLLSDSMAVKVSASGTLSSANYFDVSVRAVFSDGEKRR